MLPRSRVALAFLIALPLLLLVPLWQTARRRPRLQGVLVAPPVALALSRDGSVVAAQRSSGTVCLWSRGGPRLDLQNEGFRVGANVNSPAYLPPELRFSPDAGTILGANISTGETNSSLYAWDAQTGKIRWSAVSNVDIPDGFCRYLISSDGTRAAQRAYDGVNVFDISVTGGPQSSKKSKFARAFPLLSHFQARTAQAKRGYSLSQALAFSPDNRTLALVNTAGQLEFWDVAKGQRQSQTPSASVPGSVSRFPPFARIVPVAPPGYTAGMTSVIVLGIEPRLQYSPDGKFVALFDGTLLSLWDVAARKWLRRTVASPSSEPFLAWMPDSRSIWTGSGSVQQWSVPALVSLRELPVTGPVAVSGDGSLLATRALRSNSVPNGVWVWDIG